MPRKNETGRLNRCIIQKNIFIECRGFCKYYKFQFLGILLTFLKKRAIDRKPGY
jgi:hypothetical protein